MLAAVWLLPRSLRLDAQHGWPVESERHQSDEAKKTYSELVEKVSLLTYQNEKESKGGAEAAEEEPKHIKTILIVCPFFFFFFF